MSIAERIKQARMSKGLTQTELAKRMGVAQNTVCGYEKGTREPNVLQINALAEALGVSGDWLLESKWAYKEEEERLIQIFDSMNDVGKQNLMMLAETMANTPAYKKESSEESAIG